MAASFIGVWVVFSMSLLAWQTFLRTTSHRGKHSDYVLSTSSAQCTSSGSVATTRCVYHDLMIFDGELYFITRNDTNASLSSIMPTIVGVDQVRGAWQPIVISLEAAKQRFGDDTIDHVEERFAVLWHRLHPFNYYHTLFEDAAPLKAYLQRQASTLSTTSTGQVILFVDPWQDDNFQVVHTVFDIEHIYMKDVAILSNPMLLRHAVVGNGSYCLHTMHCANPFLPGDLETFQTFMFSSLAVYGDLPGAVAPPICERLPEKPSVLIVNRAGSRHLVDLDEEVARALSGPRSDRVAAHDVVFMEGRSRSEQARLFNRHQIIVAFHGAVLAQLLFAGPVLVYVDITPHEFCGPEGASLPQLLLANLAFHNADARSLVPLSLNYTDTVVNRRSSTGTEAPTRLKPVKASSCATQELLASFMRDGNCRGCSACILEWAFFSSSFHLKASDLGIALDRALVRYEVQRAQLLLHHHCMGTA